MQLVSCYVNLAGDLRHVVYKERISVAEVVLLREIHGHDAVNKIRPMGGAGGSMIGVAAEKLRLTDIYGRKPGGEGRQTIERLFPGYDPRMPSTLRDIGITQFDDEDPSPTAVGAPAAMSPVGAGGSPQPWQAPDAHQPPTANSQSAPPDVGGGEPGGDPPEPDYNATPDDREDLAPPPRSGLAVPGLKVT